MRGTLALAYAPRRGPLGSARPLVTATYLAPLGVVAFAFSNPIVIGAAIAAALLAGWASGALAAAGAPLRFGLLLALTVVAVNGLVVRRGETVLLRLGELPLLGRIDVTGEALAEGGVLAARILAALSIFAVWSACVDPDRLLRALRPWAARSALAATLITRLVPLAAADHRRLREAAALRGPAAAPAGRAALARRLLAGSLDRAVDAAATLELRGYGLGIRPRASRRRLERDELGLLASGAAMLALALGAAAAGVASFSAYPTLTMDAGAGVWAVALALPCLAAVPFARVSGAGRAGGAHA